jgi:hypothetical protein
MVGNMRIHMRMLPSLFLTVIIATHLTAAFAQENETIEAEYTITLRRWAQGEFPAGFYGVLVELTKTSNESIREKFCPNQNNGYNFSVLFNDVAMEELPRIQELKKEGALNGCGAHGVMANLKPGDSHPYWMPISNYYDMSKPGTYQITVTRETVPGYLLISTTVKSNTVTIAVPEPKAASREPWST